MVAASAAFGATPVFVDPAGACGGFAPCFTTIQAGVSNAGPAPAVVNVFPGTYIESVDIGLMGSSIAETPGDLTLVTVNSAGTPTPGTVDVLPATGPAFVSSVSPYPGNVTLDGCIVKSPDDTGIDMATIQGALTLRNITSDGNAGLGLSNGISGGDVRIYHSSFSDNLGGDGISLGGTPNDVVFEHVNADGNNGDGASFGVTGKVRVTSSSFSDNTDGSGLSFSAASEVVFHDVTADRNAGSGASFSISNGPMRATQSSFNDNTDGSGLSFGTASELTFDQVTADRNSGNGASFAINNGPMQVTNSSFSHNRGGNGFGGGTASDVTFDRVTADGNNASGATFGVNGPMRATDSSFSGNTNGNGLSFSTATDVRIARVTASNNGQAGVTARTGSANIIGSRFENNQGDGVELTAVAQAGSVSLTCNDIAGNGEGLVLSGPVGDVRGQQNFWGDPSGPSHPTNSFGAGDSIVDGDNGGAGTVEYIPFLITPASETGTCQSRPAPVLDTTAVALLLVALFLLPARRLARLRTSP